MDGYDDVTAQEVLDTYHDEPGASPGMPPEIAKAIIAVKKEIKQLGSDERNEHGRYGYVSVDKFYERVGPLMAANDLALLIDETSSDIRASERTDDRGVTKTVSWLFVQYELRFMHATGALSDPMRRSCALPISGPQAYGAAQSYIEKQFLRQVFKIPTGDKDADDTAQSEDAPAGRSQARTAQGGRYPSRSAGAVEKASTAALEAKRAANALRAELVDLIEMTDKKYVLDELPETANWNACREAYFQAATAEGSVEADAMRRAGLVMEGMMRSIEAKKRELLGGMG